MISACLGNLANTLSGTPKSRRSGLAEIHAVIETD